MVAERDRKDMLLEAGLALSSELSLPIVLQRIVDLAVQVTDARYGALGVLGADGTMTEFVTTGISPRERKKIGPPPVGKGILGVLIKEARPLRLADLHADPRSVGFPAGHPPMKSFLGAPVMALGRVFGNIYLTEKRSAPEFSAEDESDLVVLATQAGVAIANAWLYEEARSRERSLAALAEVANAILAGSDSEAVLNLIAAQARGLLETDLATIVTARRDGSLFVAAADGPGAPRVIGLEVPHDNSISGAVIESQRPIVVAEAVSDPRAHQPMVGRLRMGPAVFVPLRLRGRTFGTLAVANHVGGRAFLPDALEVLEAFAGQASVALEYGRAQQELQRLSIMDERERIAKELHDGIIQSLFAVGMGLQATASLSPPEVADRLEAAVTEIDRAIRDLRNYIFGLRPGILADRQLDQALRSLVAEVGERSALEIHADVDSAVAADLSPRAGDVVQLAREALSNVSRHAAAHRATVSLARSGSRAVLAIHDDGVGFDAGTVRRGQGLGNLQSRAAAMGGSARISSRPGKGTTVRISLPLPDGRRD